MFCNFSLCNTRKLILDQNPHSDSGFIFSRLTNTIHFLIQNILTMSMKILVLIPFFILLMVQLNAQDLQSPIPFISQEATSFIFLKNGKMEEGKIKSTESINRLIYSIEIQSPDGRLHSILTEDMRCMYVTSQNSTFISKSKSRHSWDREYKEYILDKNLIDQGYAFFENVEIEIGKEQVMALMQLLNPTAYNLFKVYEDPQINAPITTRSEAREGRIKTNSYYIKNKYNPLILLEKEQYHTYFSSVLAKCIEVKNKYPNIQWKDIGKHIYDYSNCLQ